MATAEFRAAAVLAELERIFFGMTAKPFDKELSKLVVAEIVNAYEDDDANAIAERLRVFAETNQAKLRQTYAEYADDLRANPLLFQPETISVFERLDSSPLLLRDRWSRVLPIELLESLGVIWGVRVS